jgi:hypothetical protein
MRSWEKKDITDILIAHHKELRESIPEDDAEQVKPLWTEVDDNCIVIENFLEETFGIIWDGLKFLVESEGFNEPYAPATKQAVEQTDDDK